MATTSSPVGWRLMAGPPHGEGYERLDAHEHRLGKRPAGSASFTEVLMRSGLRGRGGAWFPTWRKWAAVARHAQGNAVVVVNASEGEPLSSKDRVLMAHRPHLVLDGAMLAAETLGATEIVLYVSRGSPAERTIEQAVKERSGLPIRLVRTAHRYIAGESSAVISRVSGGLAKPTFSLVRAAERGVDGRPTLVQNAETMAHVAMIARYGSDWFRRLGTETAPGSTLITLCGNVRQPGVYEIDLGGSLGEVIDTVGGVTSPPGGVLLGGYFGTWLPARQLAGVTLDPDTLQNRYRAAMGCGVVAVLPGDGCPVVEATRILSYLAAESAAQCGPCINGLNALAEKMQCIAMSTADTADLQRVERWIDMVRDRGACHHPDGAVGMLASALAAAGDHLTAHIAGRRCVGTRSYGFPPPPTPGREWR